MGNAIKILGIIWVGLGALGLVFWFTMDLRIALLPGAWTDIYSALTFVGGFLIPGAMLYGIGGIYHKLIDEAAQNETHEARKRRQEQKLMNAQARREGRGIWE